MDWFDLLTVQETLKSLLQHHSLKGSVLQCSAFFMVQLSHPYMTSGKTMALTRWTFVDKVMSLLFNTLPRFVMAFLPRSKCHLNSCLQSLSAVILEPKKIKPVTFHFSPIYLPWSDGTGCHDLSVFECWDSIVLIITSFPNFSNSQCCTTRETLPFHPQWKF